MRRTKIVTTLGPASNSLEVLRKMIAAGVDIVRLNFSHGTADEKKALVQTVRTAAQAENKVVGILADLQGPKIRVAKFKEDKITLKNGEKFILDAAMPKDAGDETAVGTDYKELPNDVVPGDVLLLDDGRLVLTVTAVENTKVICKVTVGGILSNNKGINKQSGGLSADVLTDKDREDLKVALSLDVNYVAISFVRSKTDFEETKALIAQSNSRPGVIAKIERIEAIVPETLKGIIEASDGIMVARGDLGVEIGDVEVPAAQKLMIEYARNLDKPVITATQMMETMIHNNIPTRAEVSDVANAVLDGTDAVMLSAESATGDHPPLVVQTMAKICVAAEKLPKSLDSITTPRPSFAGLTGESRREYTNASADKIISMASTYAAQQFNLKAIVIVAESEKAALWASRVRSAVPIYGLSHSSLVLGKMALYGNVYPIALDTTAESCCCEETVITKLRKLGLLNAGDQVAMVEDNLLAIMSV
jgi:pyruvate kinase